MKRTIVFAATVLVATVTRAADSGLPADFDPARLIADAQATGQLPSAPKAKPGGPKLEDLIVPPESLQKEDALQVRAQGRAVVAAPTHATVLDSCREWVAQSNTVQGRLVEMGYAAGFMNAVEVYGSKLKTATIGEIAASFTRVCREHPEVPPQVVSLDVVIEFHADKPKN
ncbi:hypothetical protein [Paraburkholderia bannensis]|uniref:hypothetical protein n=1 Tax=Paraburkholderia bannensis TaxID=765414 RepID=UPI002AB7DAAF|nr:hypothetical protein [Paraburkholderia bannensis]